MHQRSGRYVRLGSTAGSIRMNATDCHAAESYASRNVSRKTTVVSLTVAFLLISVLLPLKATAQDCATYGLSKLAPPYHQPTSESQASADGSDSSEAEPAVAKVGGFYSGIVTQGTTVFGYTMTLLESNQGNVVGTSCAWVFDSPYYASYLVTGQVSNGILAFREVTILSQNANGFYWCLKSGNLTLLDNGAFLNGPWTAPGCSPGTIAVVRAGPPPS